MPGLFARQKSVSEFWEHVGHYHLTWRQVTKKSQKKTKETAKLDRQQRVSDDLIKIVLA